MQKKTLAAALRCLGYGLALLSIAYMYSVAKDAVLHRPPFTATTVITVVLLCFGHVVIPFGSAYAWKLAIEVTSRKPMTFRDAIGIYVRSNVAKYLPGNVLQYAGRNYLGVRYGWTHLQLALGSLLEVICSVAIPFGILIVLALMRLWTLPEGVFRYVIPAPVTAVVVGTTVAAVLAGAAVFWKTKGFQIDKTMLGSNPRIFLKQLAITLSKITLLSFASMMLHTAFFYVIAASLLGVQFRGVDFINIACSLTAAGYAGILAPGVPGGIGIKESLSVVLISIYGYDKASLVAVSVIARAFSVVGDALAFFVAARYVKPPSD